MAYIVSTSRVGRSQGASIFWGLVSAFFAAAACFYFWKNHENESAASVMREEVFQLREENESLASQKEHLQAGKNEAENQLKAREDLVQEKETELAAEETRVDAQSEQSQAQAQQNLAQVAVVKKFNDAIRQLGRDSAADVVERGGRPVLRLPNAQLFAPADAALKPEGKALLNQIAQALANQLDNFELRVVTYTDTAAEAAPDSTPKKDAADSKSNEPASWTLTAARASTLARFYRDQTPLPFLHVLVIARGDAEPISSNSGENHARNRRLEITVTPLPVAFHAPEPDSEKAVGPANVDHSTPTPAPTPAAPPAAKEKAKPKKAEKEKTSAR